MDNEARRVLRSAHAVADVAELDGVSVDAWSMACMAIEAWLGRKLPEHVLDEAARIWVKYGG